jgi:hypothetical protein
MVDRDRLTAYLTWFLQQPDAFRFDADAAVAHPVRPKRSAIVIPFRR